MAENVKLDGHHRVTVEKIFQHPVGHNIQWHDVLSLLERVETETFDPPRHHDIDEQMVVDLRRMLKGAGIGPTAG
jgi:hypothetical protein